MPVGRAGKVEKDTTCGKEGGTRLPKRASATRRGGGGNPTVAGFRGVKPERSITSARELEKIEAVGGEWTAKATRGRTEGRKPMSGSASFPEGFSQARIMVQDRRPTKKHGYGGRCSQ